MAAAAAAVATLSVALALTVLALSVAVAVPADNADAATSREPTSKRAVGDVVRALSSAAVCESIIAGVCVDVYVCVCVAVGMCVIERGSQNGAGRGSRNVERMRPSDSHENDPIIHAKSNQIIKMIFTSMCLNRTTINDNSSRKAQVEEQAHVAISFE